MQEVPKDYAVVTKCLGCGTEIYHSGYCDKTCEDFYKLKQQRGIAKMKKWKWLIAILLVIAVVVSVVKADEGDYLEKLPEGFVFYEQGAGVCTTKEAVGLLSMYYSNSGFNAFDYAFQKTYGCSIFYGELKIVKEIDYIWHGDNVLIPLIVEKRNGDSFFMFWFAREIEGISL